MNSTNLNNIYTPHTNSNEMHNLEVLSNSIQILAHYRGSFNKYLKEVYKDLCMRNEDIDKGKLSRISFENLLDLPLVVTEKIFNAFNKSSSDQLEEEEFIEGFVTLYSGNIEKKIILFFEIFDIQREGRIMREDVTLLLSYLHQIRIDDDMTTLYEIIDGFWGRQNSMNLKEFSETIEQKNSDIVILFLSYLFMMKPFSDESVKFYHQITNGSSIHAPLKHPSKFKFIPNSDDLNMTLHSTSSHSINSFNKDSSKEFIMDNFLFNKVALPSRLLNMYLAQNLHFNIKIIDNATSSHKCSDPISNKRLSYTFSNETSDGGQLNVYKEQSQVMEEELFKNIKLWGSPIHSTDIHINHTNEIPDDHFGFTWDVDSQMNEIENNANPFINNCINNCSTNCNNTCNINSFNNNVNNQIQLNISNIHHGHKHHHHEDTFSSEHTFNNSFSHYNPITDEHFEVIVYKQSTSLKAEIKSYKLISIGSDLFFFKEKHNQNVSLEYKGFKGLHHLSGCYVDAINSEEVIVNGESFYPLKFLSSNSSKIIYDVFYFKSFNDLKLFVDRIRFRVGLRHIQDFYELLEELGKGQFGKVRLARNKKTGEKVAVKIIKKTYIKSKEIQMIKYEIDIMKFLKNTNHPHIVKTYDIFEGRTSLYVVMELLEGGNLNNFLVDQGVILKESISKEIMLQICRGIKYLHQFGIIHRDLKPENIMLLKKSNTPHIKIMDFGLSKVLTKYDKTGEGYGSLCYLAPEILLKQNYDHKVDIWSFGIILYYLLSGYLPFDDSKDEIITIAKKIVNLDLKHVFNLKTSHFSLSAKNLICKCLERNSMKRISSFQMVDHEWFWI